VNRQGVAAEDAAVAYLQLRGLVLVERNYNCRFGEIDLIMREGSTLVFVEVRQRRNTNFGSAAESITARKRQRLLLAARHYLGRTRARNACRFDAALLAGDGAVEWLKDAFGE
jgi:putative endonuclease